MNDNRGAKDLTIFVAGVLMCAAGLYLFLSNVSVQTHFWGGGVHFFGIIGGAGIPSGLVTVPFIIGIVFLCTGEYMVKDCDSSWNVSYFTGYY